MLMRELLDVLRRSLNARSRLLLVVAGMGTMAIAAGIFVSVEGKGGPEAAIPFFVLGAFSLVPAYFSTFVRFLEKGGVARESIGKASEEIEGAAEEVRKLRAELEEQIRRIEARITEIGAGVSTSDREVLIRRLMEELTSRLDGDYARMNEAERGNHGPLIKSRFDVDEHFSRVQDRLREEGSRQSRRGAVNLVIGITITGLAIWILFTSIQITSDAVVKSVQTNHSSSSEAMWGLLPPLAVRIALAVFVQIFAFFFLRLYRQSLNESKYFQNEMTNIDLKRFAYELALRDVTAESRSRLIVELASGDRNLLKSGDTSMELERLRGETALSKEAIAVVQKLVDRSK